MTKYTPLQTVNKCHRELWWTIRLMGSAEVQLDDNSNAKIDLVEVEKVLRHACLELGRIIRYMEAEATNRRNMRPGVDLALKAQVAKSRLDMVIRRGDREDDQSHK